MRKIFLFFIIVFCSHQLIWAQTSIADSLKKVKADSIHKADSLKTDSLHKADSIKRFISLQDSIHKKNCGCCVLHHKANPNFGEWLLIFVPLLIFLIIFFAIGRPKDFAFKDALTENEQTKQTKDNPQYTGVNLEKLKNVPNLSILLPPTVEVTSDSATYRPSISRYIAFITSILTLIVALGMGSFFIYHYISTGCPPDLSALSTILIALGIGVAPYAFNKISTAIKNKSE